MLSGFEDKMSSQCYVHICNCVPGLYKMLSGFEDKTANAMCIFVFQVSTKCCPVLKTRQPMLCVYLWLCFRSPQNVVRF